MAESCTGGLMAGRLTDRAGSSAYVLGGVVVYSNEAKVALAGVPAGVDRARGRGLAGGRRRAGRRRRGRFGADVGIGITGIAGPGGGTPEKPVGMVCVCVASGDGAARRARCSSRATAPMIRDRTTTAVMHLLRRLLLRSADWRRDAAPTPSPAASFVALELPARGPRRAGRVPGRRARTRRSGGRSPPRRSTSRSRSSAAARPTDVPAVDEVLVRRGGPGPRLALADALLLPPRRPRVLCAALADPDGTLAALQSRVSDGLAAAGVYTPETRPFRAHATVARLRPRARAAAPIAAAPEPLEFRGEALTLFLSRLHPHGARYEPLVRLNLH